MGTQYKISKKLYESLRNPLFNEGKNKKKLLTKKEVIDYINLTFGLKDKVDEIIFD